MKDHSSQSLHEVLAWQYANLARADVALTQGATKFKQLHHIIRSKLYKGIITGTMCINSFFRDEQFKLSEHCCVYCGSTENLSLDHLIPRKKLGTDLSENLVLACRTCNSSKREKDMLTWMISNSQFPSLYLLRRYMKLIYFYCKDNNLLNMQFTEAEQLDLPFDLSTLEINLSPLYHLNMISLTQTCPINMAQTIKKNTQKKTSDN